MLAAAACSSVFALGACSSTPNVSEERVAHSEAVVRQAEGTVGRSESGAIEMQQAKEKLTVAQEALRRERPIDAERAALQAQLYAELAIARAQSAEARNAAAEMLASVQTLREEAERNSPTPR